MKHVFAKLFPSLFFIGPFQIANNQQWLQSVVSVVCIIVHFCAIAPCLDCNMTICDSEVPSCDIGNRLVIGYSTLSCCPEYRCGED